LAAQSSAEEVAFDQKRALNRLDVLCRTAEELDQISAAAGCEELIGKHRGMSPIALGCFQSWLRAN
jgi:hypothetical protein